MSSPIRDYKYVRDEMHCFAKQNRPDVRMSLHGLDVSFIFPLANVTYKSQIDLHLPKFRLP